MPKMHSAFAPTLAAGIMYLFAETGNYFKATYPPHNANAALSFPCSWTVAAHAARQIERLVYIPGF